MAFTSLLKIIDNPPMKNNVKINLDAAFSEKCNNRVYAIFHYKNAIKNYFSNAIIYKNPITEFNVNNNIALAYKRKKDFFKTSMYCIKEKQIKLPEYNRQSKKSLPAYVNINSYRVKDWGIKETAIIIDI